MSEFGGLGSFRKEFIELMIDRDIKKHSELVKIIESINKVARSEQRLPPFIQGFDMSQPNFLPSRDDVNFLTALDQNNSTIYGYFITEKNIYDYIESLDDDVNATIIKKCFGLDGNESQSLQAVGDGIGISKEAVSVRLRAVKKDLKSKHDEYKPDILESSRRAFISSFFEENDIFIDGTELPQEKKDNLSKIYRDGLLKKEENCISERLKRVEEIPIDELGFPIRILNVLQRNGYDTLNKVLDGFRTKEIYEIPGLGRKTIKEIQSGLEKFGIRVVKGKVRIEPGGITITSAFEAIFGTPMTESMSGLDREFCLMLNALKLARQHLQQEKEICKQLNQEFDNEKQKQLQMIETALGSQGIEL